jgi:hypothetical protein
VMTAIFPAKSFMAPPLFLIFLCFFGLHERRTRASGKV